MKTISEVAFERAGGPHPLLLLPVYVNGEGPFKFPLDTGAALCLLTPELSDRFGLEAHGSREAMGAGGKLEMPLSRIECLRIGDAEVGDLEVGVTADLHRIGAAIGVPIDGNVGYNFLRNFVLSIDYVTGSIALSSEASSEKGVPFEANPLVLLPVKVNGQDSVTFAVDTGASGTVISEHLAGMLGLQTSPTGPMTGGGGEVKTALATVESLQIGDAVQGPLAVAVSDFLSMLSERVAVAIEGVVGYNFLSKYRVTFDYPASRLVLE